VKKQEIKNPGRYPGFLSIDLKLTVFSEVVESQGLRTSALTSHRCEDKHADSYHIGKHVDNILRYMDVILLKSESYNIKSSE